MIAALERDLPPATLLLGPEPGPAMTEAFAAVRKIHNAVTADVLLRRHLSASDARHVVRFAQTAPFGPFKVVIIGLDGSTPVAQNILLKVLEEPPGSIRFILAASERPLPTIVSRCQVVTVADSGERAEPDQDVARQVTSALKAAQSGDLRGLDAALRGWDDAHHAVLSLMLAEIAAGSSDYGGSLTPVQARKLLGALSRFGSAHARLAAHAALVTVLVP